MPPKSTLVPAIIEYQDDRPFTVMLMVPGAQRMSETWDVEWCKRDRRLYAHLSGSGGEAMYVVTTTHSGRRVYVRPDVPCGVYAQVDGAWTTTPITREELTAAGYEFVTEEPADPFDGARQYPDEDVRCEHCPRCDDWLPIFDDTDRPCEHIEWCDFAGWCLREGEEHNAGGYRHPIQAGACFEDYDEDQEDQDTDPGLRADQDWNLGRWNLDAITASCTDADVRA
jgi:hypothetical protein